jgi:hypothetical protein
MQKWGEKVELLKVRAITNPSQSFQDLPLRAGSTTRITA